MQKAIKEDKKRNMKHRKWNINSRNKPKYIKFRWIKQLNEKIDSPALLKSTQYNYVLCAGDII